MGTVKIVGAQGVSAYGDAKAITIAPGQSGFRVSVDLAGVVRTFRSALIAF